MAKTGKRSGDDGPIIIKKYANRRLYNTRDSKYITLDFLAELVRQNIEFQVLDAKSGEDITHSVLTQIIMEEENSGGQTMLPVNFLRQLISLYGGDMQATVPQYLENAMAAFYTGQQKVESVIESALATGPFAEITRKNLEMMKAARDAFMPGANKEEEPSEELDDLKRQMAEIQAKIDAHSKK